MGQVKHVSVREQLGNSTQNDRFRVVIQRSNQKWIGNKDFHIKTANEQREDFKEGTVQV